MLYQAEEPKFCTSGRYHFELRSLTSCLAVKFITFTFKKASRYTSVSFVLFFSWQFSAMFSFTESDAALSSVAGRTSLLQAASVGRNVEKEFILYWCFLIPCVVLYILILPFMVYSIQRRYKISQFDEKERKIFSEVCDRIEHMLTACLGTLFYASNFVGV
jgi:hypothetical protein